jgi:hypothetical protein
VGLSARSALFFAPRATRGECEAMVAPGAHIRFLILYIWAGIMGALGFQ